MGLTTKCLRSPINFNSYSVAGSAILGGSITSHINTNTLGIVRNNAAADVQFTQFNERSNIYYTVAA